MQYSEMSVYEARDYLEQLLFEAEEALNEAS